MAISPGPNFWPRMELCDLRAALRAVQREPGNASIPQAVRNACRVCTLHAHDLSVEPSARVARHDTSHNFSGRVPSDQHGAVVDVARWPAHRDAGVALAHDYLQRAAG